MRFGFSFDALTFQCRCSCSLVGGRLLITFVPAQLMYSRVMRKRLRYRSVPTRCHGALCQHRAKGPRGRFGETLRKGLCFLVGPPMQIMNAGLMDWADYLRDEAAKYRQLAETAEDVSIKQELLDLAAVCEEAANNIEDRMPGG